MDYEKPFIFIDTNFGLDEALMIKMAFNSFDFELVGISTSSGIMSPKKAADNIVALSANEGLYLSVSKGDDLDLSYEDRDILTTSDDYIENMPAFESIIDKADDCGKLDILTTGPLTNIAKALDEADGLEDYISHIFILGGSLGAEVSENFRSDYKAIDKVLNTGIDIFIIPDELSRSVILTDDMIEKLRNTDRDLETILDEFIKVPEEKRFLKAPLLLYLTQAPEAFIFEESGFKVDSDEEKGALKRVSSRKNNYLANKVNEEAFYDFILGNLL